MEAPRLVRLEHLPRGRKRRGRDQRADGGRASGRAAWKSRAESARELGRHGEMRLGLCLDGRLRRPFYPGVRRREVDTLVRPRPARILAQARKEL